MDNATLVTILWTIVGAVGTTMLGLLAWGVKSLIAATFENTVQIKLLNEKLEKLIAVPGRIEKMEIDLRVAHDRIREIYKNGG